MAIFFLLQALQLRVICEAISQHGNGYCHGKGKHFLWLSLMLYLDTLFVVLNLLKYQDAGMDWILYLDTDELIYPAGAREYSLRRLLLDVPPNVDMVIFPNYVSALASVISASLVSVTVPGYEYFVLGFVFV